VLLEDGKEKQLENNKWGSGDKGFLACSKKKIGEKRKYACLECGAIDLAIYPLPLFSHHATTSRCTHTHKSINKGTIFILLFLFLSS